MERNKEPQRVFIYVNDDKAREEVEKQVPELKQMTYTLNEDLDSGER